MALPSWLQLSAVSGSGDTQITITASTTEEFYERAYSLLISGHTKTLTIPVTQEPSENTLSVYPSSHVFAYTGGTFQYTVTSNSDWTITSHPNWLTFDVLSGTTGTSSVNVTAGTNYDAQKQADIVFSAITTTASTHVTQDTFVQELEVSPSAYTYDYTGGTYQFTINSNSDWNISGYPIWATLSTTSGVSGTSVVTITASTNSTSTARTATMTVTGVSGSTTFSIEQGCLPYINITPTLITRGMSAGVEYVEVDTNGHWAITNVPAWCSVSSVSGDSQSTGFTVSFTTNNTGSMRTGDITVRHTESGVDYTVSLRQLTDPAQSYLTFIIDSNGYIPWHKFYGYEYISETEQRPQYGAANHGIYYRKNGGSWTYLRANTTHNVSVSTNDIVEFKGYNTGYGRKVYQAQYDGPDTFGSFFNLPSFRLYGNIMSLIDGDNFTTISSFTDTWSFSRLFGDAVELTDASGLVLPATGLTDYCYERMFYNSPKLRQAPTLPSTTLTSYCYSGMFSLCSSLTTAPTLPSTTLAPSCYYTMFDGCTSLTTAPALPATSLTDSCYAYMFAGCSLTTVPTLPATSLTDSCYAYMFANCKSLTTAPELPVTTLESGCYKGMFLGCTALTTAPVLSATTLADSCYKNMFSGCTSLTTAPELPAISLESDCYYGMFQGCTSLTTAPDLPAKTLTLLCYSYMFSGCTSLNYIKCLATSGITSQNLRSWVSNVASSGTFVKNPSATWPRGTNGIPNNWTVVDVTPSTYLTFNIDNSGDICWKTTNASWSKTIYYRKNDGQWTSLTPTTAGTMLSVVSGDVVELKADNSTYYNNGDYCTFSGTTAAFSVFGNIMSLVDSVSYSNLSAFTGNRVFQYLFYNCTGLTDSASLLLPATSLTQYCYGYMFQGCTSLTTAPELPSTSLAYACYIGMFQGCTSLSAAPELPATSLMEGCYANMFRGCANLTTAPELPTASLVKTCYANMFSGCTNLNYVECLATDISADSCVSNWLKNVASTGTFVKDPSMSSWPSGISGIPNNWTVVNAT